MAVKQNIVDEALSVSNLLNDSQDAHLAHSFIDFYNNIEPPYRNTIEEAFNLGRDTWHFKRKAEGGSRVRHLIRMAGYTIEQNLPYMTPTTMPLLVAKVIGDIHHDDIEERLRRILPHIDAEKHEQVREEQIERGREELRHTLRTGARRSNVGLSNELYAGLPLDEIIAGYHDPFTPGFKAEGLGAQSYINTLDKIVSLKGETTQDPTATAIAALFRTTIKVADRVDDMNHLFLATDGIQKLIDNDNLENLLAAQKENQSFKATFRSEYRNYKEEAEKTGSIEEISSAKRTEAIWKAIFSYNAAAQLLDTVRQIDHPHVNTYRAMLARMLADSLAHTEATANRLSLFLVNFHDLPRKGRKKESGAAFSDNDAHMYEELKEMLRQYKATPEFEQLQGEPGREGLSLFHGSTAHMARVERKQKPYLRRFQHDYMDHLIRCMTAQALAQDRLPHAEAYARAVTEGTLPATTGLKYHHNQRQQLVELINP